MKKRVCSYYVFLLVFTLVFSTFVTPVSFGAINESATEKASALSDSDKNKSESSASDQNTEVKMAGDSASDLASPSESDTSDKQSDYDKETSVPADAEGDAKKKDGAESKDSTSNIKQPAAKDNDFENAAPKKKGAKIKSSTGKDAKVDIDVMVDVLLMNTTETRIVDRCTVRLYANGKEMESRVLEIPYDEPNFYKGRKCTHTVFESMPKYDGKGQFINYSITIDKIDETVINTHQGKKEDGVYYYTASIVPRTTNVTVDFYYADYMEGYNADFEPVDFEVTLLQNGKPYATKTVEHYYDSAKLVVFEDVPIYDKNGETYKYTIDEDAVIADVGEIINKTNYLYPYALVYRVNGRDKQPPEDNVKVTVYPYSEGTMPEKFSYTIWADDEPVVEETKTSKGGYRDTTFYNYYLPKQKNERDIVYKVTAKSEVWSHICDEVKEVDDYIFRPHFIGNDEKVPVKVALKFPEGFDQTSLPDEITGNVYNSSSLNADVVCKKDGGWTGTVMLPRYSKSAYEYDYELKNLPNASGLAPIVSPIEWDDDGGHFEVTYVPAADIKIKVIPEANLTDEEKQLVINRGSFYISIKKMKYEEPQYDDPSVEEFRMKANEEKTVNTLPSVDKNGNPIKYYVDGGVSLFPDMTLYNQGYVCSTTGDMENGFTVIVGKKEKTEGDAYVASKVEVEVRFMEEEQDFTPPEITLRLYKNNQPTEYTHVLKEDFMGYYSGRHTFVLPRGESYTDYEVRMEPTPEGFFAEIDKYDSKYSNSRSIYINLYKHQYEYSDMPYDVTLTSSNVPERLFEHASVHFSVNGSSNYSYLENANNGRTLWLENVRVKADGKDLPLDDVNVYMLNASDRFFCRAEYDSNFDGQGNGGFHVYVDYVDEDYFVYTVSKAWDAYNGHIELMIGHKWMSEDEAHGVFIEADPDPITVRIYRDGAYYDTVKIGESTDAQADRFTSKWKSKLVLERYDPEDGHEYKYTFKEDSVEGFISTQRVTGWQAGGVFDVHLFNSLEPGTYVASKNWDDENNKNGARPESILVTLFANGIPTLHTALLNAENGWRAVFNNLPTYDADEYSMFGSGSKIVYTIFESILSDYFNVEKSDGEYIGSIKNSYTGKTKISGKKTWDDNNDAAGKRPESITINLLANGEKTQSKTVTAKDDWKYTFTDLPTTMYGEKVNYTISEEPVAGYETSIKGFDVTNTCKDKKKESKLSVVKTSQVKEAKVGDVVPFTITVSNKGEATAANIKVVDIMPEELDYVSSEPAPVMTSEEELVWKVNVPANGNAVINLKARINEKASGKIINKVVIYDEDGKMVPESSGGQDEVEIALKKIKANSPRPDQPKQTASKTVSKKVKKEAKKTPMKKSSPGTGDEAPINYAVLIMILAAAVMATCRFTRK